MIVWHNGVYTNAHDVHFSLDDRVRYGDGVFDTLRAQNGHIHFLDAHLARLRRHANVLSIPLAITDADMADGLWQILHANGLHHGAAVLNILLTRGAGPRGLMPPAHVSPTLILRALTFPPDLPPIHAHIVQGLRRNEYSPLSRIKSMNYGENILALLEAQQNGANEAIMLNSKGLVACASAATLYVLQKGKLHTPRLEDGAMEGIIRAQLLDLGLAVEATLSPDDLATADGIFLSNAVRGLYPVHSLNGTLAKTSALPFNPADKLKG